MRTLAVALLGLLLMGCASDRTMRERFPDGAIRILTDEKGRRYIVNHCAGDIYSVRPYEELP